MTQSKISRKWLIALSATLVLLAALLVVGTAMAQGPDEVVDVQTYSTPLESPTPTATPSPTAVPTTGSATSSALVEYRVYVNKKAKGTTAKLQSVTYANAYTTTTEHLADTNTDAWSHSFRTERLDQQIFVYAEPMTSTLSADWTDITVEIYVDHRPYATVTGQTPYIDTTFEELLAQPVLTPVSYHVYSTSELNAITFSDLEGMHDVNPESDSWSYSYLLPDAEQPIIRVSAEADALPDASPEIVVEVYVKGNLRRRLDIAGTTAEIDTEIWHLLSDDYRDAPYTVGTLGDVNGDGEISIIDALLVSRYSVGLKVLDGFNRGVADANCNGTIDSDDALTIVNYYVGNITAFSCTVP